MNETRKHTGTSATIGCDAENCAYNEPARTCSASNIMVHGTRAQGTGDTSSTTYTHTGCC